MSAIVANGSIRQLDTSIEPENQVSKDDVGDPESLARVIMSTIRDIAKIKRRWISNFIDFRDIAVDGTGTTKILLPHGYKNAVNYWPIKWTGGIGPSLSFDPSSDANTLVLVSNFAGVVTIRVELAG